ncbi:MAG: hypothetical protein DWQ18_02495 [Crenarchaeota archaeon]|nr:MAG: hypothetical protein DWQ17_06035 [Thermoproteota archaeon]RDJ33806.1 MAG: hypothetical protein DWQ18_02495 [Thermoproteota archaeon]RDJ37085.1 MAG: hypothetical protein DWQ13_08130 [Thermoproteota archaeon]RDJ37380.1 MAG: hypothetical protein DWQ19_02705 [Thermoproteota archaeon]
MLQDSSIRKSIDEYIKRRIKEIPLEVKETFFKTKQVWKCENEVDFLYGYYVGKIEESTLHYLLKATRASAGGFIDSFEIRGMIESHRSELLTLIKNTLTENQ